MATWVPAATCFWLVLNCVLRINLLTYLLYIDSDESDSDEMLPLGAFWPAPEEEEWTVVERSHGIIRSARDIDSDWLYDSGDKLNRSGVRCKQLDYINWNNNRYDLNRPEPERNSCTRSEALPSNRKEVTQIDRSPTEDS